MRNEAPAFVRSTDCSCQLVKETAAARLQIVHVDISESLLQEDDGRAPSCFIESVDVGA